MPSVYFASIGCIEQRVGLSIMRNYFEANGWTPIAVPDVADLIVVETCGVTETKEGASADNRIALISASQDIANHTEELYVSRTC